MPTFHLPERDPDDNSMSIERFEEIAEAESKGEPLDLSPEEQAEFEQGKQDMAETRERLLAMVNNAVRPLNPLSDWAGSLQSKLSDSLEQQREQLARATSPSPADYYERMQESIRESQEEQDRVEAELAQAAAERVQREMLQTEALQELVSQAKDQGKVNTRMLWIGGATLLVSIVAAVLAGVALGMDDGDQMEVPATPETVTETKAP